jgi:hypothetical protein
LEEGSKRDQSQRTDEARIYRKTPVLNVALLSALFFISLFDPTEATHMRIYVEISLGFENHEFERLEFLSDTNFYKNKPNNL